jgi:hypothetical protein
MVWIRGIIVYTSVKCILKDSWRKNNQKGFNSLFDPHLANFCDGYIELLSVKIFRNGC